MELTPELARKNPERSNLLRKLPEPVSPLRGSSEINIGQKNPLHEIRLRLTRAEKKESSDGSEGKLKKTDGFEPFVNPEPTNDPLFVNGYNGNYAQKMELNRKGIEWFLKIAHLDGRVVLTSFVHSRKPSSEVQGNELVAKRNLFLGEKIKEDNKENPYHRVVSTPEGWRIEINDTRIREDLEKKHLTGNKQQKKFVQNFNRQLSQGLWESMWREKLTTVKDKENLQKILFSGLTFGALPMSSFLAGVNVETLTGFFTTEVIVSISFAIAGFVLKYRGGKLARNFDAPWEYFMPLVEIDKVARSFSYLSLKGRTLVREKKEEK